MERRIYNWSRRDWLTAILCPTIYGCCATRHIKILPHTLTCNFFSGAINSTPTVASKLYLGTVNCKTWSREKLLVTNVTFEMLRFLVKCEHFIVVKFTVAVPWETPQLKHTIKQVSRRLTSTMVLLSSSSSYPFLDALVVNSKDKQVEKTACRSWKIHTLSTSHVIDSVLCTLESSARLHAQNGQQSF